MRQSMWFVIAARTRRGGRTGEEEVFEEVEDPSAKIDRMKVKAVKRDFFGRIVNVVPVAEGERAKGGRRRIRGMMRAGFGCHFTKVSQMP
jgi:hypothetical protein